MAKATATFDANDSDLQRAFSRIDKGLLGVQAKFAAVGKFAAGLLAVSTAALIAGAAGLKNALDLGGELNDLSNNTGESVKKLAYLRQEFSNAGKTAQDVGPVLAKMMNNLEGGTADATIAKLGLNLDDLKKKTPVDQFHALGDAINGLQSPSERTAASMAIFGKSGATLLSVFASKGFGDAAAQVGGQAEILARDAALFDDVGDKLNLAGEKTQGFFVGVADKVIPVLKPLLDKFAVLDFSQYGQQLGDVIAFLIQAIIDGRIGEIILLSAQMGLGNLVNGLVGALAGLGAGLWQMLKENFSNALFLFDVLTTSDFWAGMGDALLGNAQRFIAMLDDGIAYVLDQLSGVPIIGKKFASAASAVRETAADLRGKADANVSKGSDLLAPFLDKAGARVGEAIGNIGPAVSAGYASGSNIVDTTSINDKLGVVVDGVMESARKVTIQSLKEAPTVDPAAVARTTEGVAMDTAKVSTLQKIGGAAGATNAGDPLLRENQRQTGLLERIAAAIEIKGDGRPQSITAVFA